MEERRNNIDEFFRQNMGNHAEAPPPVVWDRLEQRLDSSGGRKKPFPFWWIGAIGVVVMVSATLIAGSLVSDNRPTTVDVEQVETNTQPTLLETKIAQAEITTPESVPTPPVPQNTLPTNDPIAAHQPKTTSSNIPATEPSKSYQTNNNNNNDNHTDNNHPVAQATARQPEQTVAALPKRGKASPNLIASTAPMASSPVSANPIYPSGKLRMTEPEAEAIKPADATAIQAPVTSQATVVAMPKPVFASGLPSTLFEEEQASDAGFATPSEILPASAMTSAIPMEDTSKKKKLFKKSDTSQLNDTEKEVVTNEPKKVKTKTASGKLPIEAGIKLGFSKGFNSGWRADRWVIAPYAEYRLPYNFSVAIQPAYSSGKVNKAGLQFTDKGYHEVTGNRFDSTRRISAGHIDSSVLTPNPPDTVFYTYSYVHTYDSVQVSYTSKQNTLWEVEIPLILKYRINRNLTVFAGGSATISSVVETVETIDRYSGLTKTYLQEAVPQSYYVTQPNQAPPPGPQKLDPTTLFSHSTDPFSTFTPVNMQTSGVKTLTRYGYMIGVSATLKDRWMVDVMMHQSGVDATAVPDKNIQKLYTQPYFRVMVGYKLIK
ncbi:MAG: hypothetical protein H6551_11700 [Chitinophagales bacterium]|nr:hypothetical protein [Chitinophagaceae bacterium]MCB9065792.1 hypothetical protein [Chitinophagales bacterium]